MNPGFFSQSIKKFTRIKLIMGHNRLSCQVNRQILFVKIRIFENETENSTLNLPVYLTCLHEFPAAVGFFIISPLRIGFIISRK